ncbi:hypothetical protein QEV83_12010 [Methylocapsa sp. D3K7]|uniref:hypothetical protein n=1 Tax=Methylocapsa sp. D3K7 TaxID=3041435 RepID=UPI00244E8721|nr:hypothetical protein [Methylocapsa sp. D3K7]WGJ13423.1 hypothetical protein QEV83_12010 [Methylocapsa sp. D3K7]
MNASKTVLFAIGAIVMTTGTAVEASAHAYAGSSTNQTTAIKSLRHGQIGGQASTQPLHDASRVAINPQPLPPGGEE